MKTLESTHTIRFPDCDPFNHLNNSRYIDYFINAREDHLAQHHQFNIYKYARDTGKSWVVSQNQIAYLAPALLMEQVLIQTAILEWNPSDILVEMRMWDQQKTKLKAVLWTRFVHYDLKEGKRMEHDAALLQRFQDSINPLKEKMDFESRVAQLRKLAYDELK